MIQTESEGSLSSMGHLSVRSDTCTLHKELNGHYAKPAKGAFACMVNSEIGAVLAVMRRNVRWGVRYAADDDQLEHTLIHSLKELRKKIFSWHHNWQSVEPSVYLQPFLDVIRSDETGAPITGVALSSVYKILNLDVLDADSVNVGEAMHMIVDAVTTCRFEVTDAASEEVVLMKILQVLLACMKSKASVRLNNQHVCNIVNACFRVVHQASSKGELLQRIARHTMHELVRCIFSRLPDIESQQHSSQMDRKVDASPENGISRNQQENGCESDGEPSVTGAQNFSGGNLTMQNEGTKKVLSSIREGDQNIEKSMLDPFGVPCMVEIFQFLCSLLNVVEHFHAGPRSNPMAYDEDVPLFALGLINSTIELGGSSFSKHPELLSLIQGELFRNLMHFGMSMSPLILSTVCSIVLNLYHYLRAELKVQFEAFFSCVLLRVAQGKNGASYQQQEVALEALVDFCRQPSFMAEMYANFDSDITCNNVFEDLANLLSKSAFPVNGPLSAMHIVALDGLISMIHSIAERSGNEVPASEDVSPDPEEYKAFWTIKCESYTDPSIWVPHVRGVRRIKRRLMVGVDRFNHDPKKGLQVLQEMHLLPDHRDPKSIASLFRYTVGLDKNLIGDFLGNHDEFCIDVLREFAGTFNFQGMNLDTALRLFLGTFRLPGESQKIQRILEAFAERYYEQSTDTLASKDATLLLSYSLIMLNTDQHNVQVKKKMTEEDFIRNNRLINDGKDLPREYISDLFHSICENEIQMFPDQGSGFSSMTSGRWINMMHKADITAPFIACNPGALLDHDVLSILLDPTIAAMSVVFDQAEQEEVLQACVDGFLSICKILASYHLDKRIDDLVVSLCKFIAVTDQSVDEATLAFGDDAKTRIATKAVFDMANGYGDYLRSGWKNVLDCVLRFQKFGFLPARLSSDAADDLEPSPELERVKQAVNSSSASHTLSGNTPRKSSGLMGRFSQLLSFDSEEIRSLPTEEELAAHQRARETIESCHIDSIFNESKFLQAESLLQLVRSLTLAASRLSRAASPGEEEGTAVFCLDLLILITLNNRDRIMLIWQSVYEHISNIVQSTVMPCTLVEKAVFGLLKVCRRLLPYKEDLTDELLKSLQLILKLDARVADAYCEPITHEVMRLVKSNASHIRSQVGWRTITSLLSITARHPEASEAGFETLTFIMSDGAYLLPSNFILCVDAARQFAESRLGEATRSVSSLDLMAGSVMCLTRWSSEARSSASQEAAEKVRRDIEEMWLRLVQGLKKVCLDSREVVRNHAILTLQRSMVGVDGIELPNALWFQCFDVVVFTLLDELLEAALESSPKDYRKIEETLVLATKLMTKVFLQLLQDLSQQPSFCKLWLGVLNRMERYIKVKFRGKRSEKIHELIPELLKNVLLVMRTTGILKPSDDIGGESFWQLTWLHVNNICPSLQSEIFPKNEAEQSQEKS